MAITSYFQEFMPGMIYDLNQLKWDRRFLELAKFISNWSKDPSTKVGAVLVNKDRIVVGMGYNGFPRDVEDSEERYLNRELKYKMVVHAEVNAIINAGTNAKNSTMYLYPSFYNPPVCPECCKFIIQSGVSKIVSYENSDLTEEQKERWKPSMEISKIMLQEANILFETIKE